MKSNSKLSCVLLAAGCSRRMPAENKLLLPFGDNTIIEQVISQLSKLSFNETIVVTGFEKTKVEKRLKSYSCKIVHNPLFKNGMTSSIIRGISSLQKISQGAMICLGDMPFLRLEEYARIADSFIQYYSEKPLIVRPVYESKKGNPVVFSHHFFEEIIALTEMEGCKSIVKKNKQFVKDVTLENELAFIDIDTPLNYHKWKSHV